jgi:hypothetical protein
MALLLRLFFENPESFLVFGWLKEWVKLKLGAGADSAFIGLGRRWTAASTLRIGAKKYFYQ